MKASALALRHSKSLARRRHRPSHAPFDRLRMKGSLDDPSFRQDRKAFHLIGTFDDLDTDVFERLLQPVLEFRPLIAAVGVELHEKRIKPEQRGHHQNAAVTVLYVGGMDERVHQEALRIDENMPLLALDLLSRIIAMRVMEPPFSALFTLWLSMTAAVGCASRSAFSRHLM